MRRGLIQICALLALLLLTAVAQAQDAYSTNADGSIYTYSTNADGSADIVAYAGPPWVVTIPTNINGLTVTTIGYEAFYDGSLTSLTIPNSVTSIGALAFYSCSSLTNMTIIPDSVTNIGYQAFLRCTHLASITVDASNPAYSSMNGALFDKAQATLLQFPAGGLGGSYTIPASVTSIGDYAFEFSTLTNVTMPNSLTSIGDNAFANCFSLTSAVIPNSVTNIGVEAFLVCVGLTNVTIPNSVTNIGFAAFGICNSLTSAFFLGNAPPDTGSIFLADSAVVYYLAGTTGWGSTFGSRPTKLWNPQANTLGVAAGNFGFNITGSSNLVIVVEAATNLINPVWSPVATNTLNTFIGTNGSSYFSDPQWANYPNRFYRLRSP